MVRITDTGWSPELTRALDTGIERELPRIAAEWVDHVRDRTRRGVARAGWTATRCSDRVTSGRARTSEDRRLIRVLLVRCPMTWQTAFRNSPTRR